MSRKRTNRRGHIEQRGPTSVRIIVSLGKLPDKSDNIYKETINRSTLTQAYEDAEKRLTEILHLHDQGRAVGTSRMLYSDYLDYWLNSHVKVANDITTYDGYERHVRTRLIPGLGHYQLVELNPLIISEFYAKLQEDGKRLDNKPGALSPNTIRKIHSTVRSSLAQAVRWRILTYNPAVGATLPEYEEPQRRVWSESNLARFLDYIDGHEYFLIIVFAAYTGMRISEVAAIRWDQIHWNESYLTVERALKRPGKKWIDGKTKNRRRRKIPLPDFLLVLLRKHQAEQHEFRYDMGADWNPQNLIFTSRNGTPIDRSNFYNRVWAPIQKQFNEDLRFGEDPLPYLNIHGLRHTLGTIMARMGKVKEGTDILGHHSTAFFMDTYVHDDVEDRRSALDAFSDRLRQSSSQNLPKRKLS